MNRSHRNKNRAAGFLKIGPYGIGADMFSLELAGIIDRDRIKEREPMKEHTTFHIGGPADYFVEAGNTEELTALLSLCRKEEMPCYMLGNGSNLLVSDQGVRGLVIKLGGDFNEIRTAADGSEKRDARTGELKAGMLRAGAGVSLARLSRTACEEGLKGLEFAGGIPGTLGGALIMNAGAYGGEMKDCVKSVTAMDPSGIIRVYTGEEMQFGYRTSILQKNGSIALSAEFLLTEGTPEELLGRLGELNARRREKQPLEYPSAGSTFKRPEGYFAGKLIMDAGLRGYQVGGAAVSEKHCGFVINKENASAEDVITLIHNIQKFVYDKSGVKLEPEVRFWGEF